MRTLVGPGALQRVGLTPYYAGIQCQTTELEYLDGCTIHGCRLFYLPGVDSDPYFIQSTEATIFSAVRVPTQERAIIENIKYIDVFEEFYLVRALRKYTRQHQNLDTLREVAAHYGVSSELEFWLCDIEDTSDEE